MKIIRSNKIVLIIFVCLILFIIGLVFFRSFVMMLIIKICGVVVDDFIICGYRLFEICYMVNGKYMILRVSCFIFKICDLEEFKSLKCIEIEYFNNFLSYIFIIDIVVGLGKEW